MALRWPQTLGMRERLRLKDLRTLGCQPPGCASSCLPSKNSAWDVKKWSGDGTAPSKLSINQAALRHRRTPRAKCPSFEIPALLLCLFVTAVKTSGRHLSHQRKNHSLC